MTNYKPIHASVSIGHTHQHVVKQDETLVILQANDAITAASQSMLKGNTDYSVTTGKTFYAVEIIIIAGTVNGNFDLFSGDTADATTTQMIETVFVTPVNGPYYLPVDFTISAGKFVTITINTGVAVYTLFLVGYEK